MSVAIATGTIIGGYRVVRVLGQGATAVVFEAEGGVALKLGDPADRTRFLRGAAAQAGLSHPAIAAVRGYGLDPEHGPWLAMELADGPLPDVMTVLRAVAGALDHAHAAGVVHRDVKPSNVLAAGDRVLLADFGLARDGEPTAAGTRTGAVLGSLPYLAPEVVRGARATPASDRYALAAMAYELLTGDVPFPRRTDAAILFAHVDAPVPPASRARPGLPVAIDAVLERGLAKTPAERYAAATTFVAALEAALAGTDVGSPPRRADATTHDAEPLETGAWPQPPDAAPPRRWRVRPRPADAAAPPSGPSPAGTARSVPSGATRVASSADPTLPADDTAPPSGPSPAGTARPADQARPRSIRIASLARAARSVASPARLGIFGVAGLAVAAGLVAFAARDDTPAPAPAPVPPGHVALGSALDPAAADAVVGRDCRDAQPSGASPACTVLQTELPGRTLVIPRDGAIRAWTVRGARGELVLQVLRRRDAQIFQVVRSQPQVATKDSQRFEAALPARAGDLLALAVVPGATVGVLPDVSGARTERWTDPVSADRPPGEQEGFAHEVQLQVDFEPGARIHAPSQTTGAAAQPLPPGKEVAAGDVALPDGRRVRVALVEHGGAVHVDLFRDDTRRARIVVPDLVPGGQVVEFKPFESEGNPSQLNVAWRNPGTRSDIFHYFGLDAEALEFYS